MVEFGDARLPPRFWAKVAINSATGCWEWLANKRNGGYGRIRLAEKDLTAHRLSFETLAGPIPPGLQLDHLCRVRHCVNPAHLEPVTQQENIRREFIARPRHGRGSGILKPAPGKRNAEKTHCPAGHPYSGDNLIYNTVGWRMCRICFRKSQAAYQKRRAKLKAKSTIRYGEGNE